MTFDLEKDATIGFKLQNDTPRRNPGYRDTPARENNKKFIFELINYFFSTSIPRHTVMTGRLPWYQILLIFTSKIFKFCHNKNILFIHNLLKLDFQPSTL